jgi:hypothetical protein
MLRSLISAALTLGIIWGGLAWPAKAAPRNLQSTLAQDVEPYASPAYGYYPPDWAYGPSPYVYYQPYYATPWFDAYNRPYYATPWFDAYNRPYYATPWF